MEDTDDNRKLLTSILTDDYFGWLTTYTEDDPEVVSGCEGMISDNMIRSY